MAAPGVAAVVVVLVLLGITLAEQSRDTSRTGSTGSGPAMVVVRSTAGQASQPDRPQVDAINPSLIRFLRGQAGLVAVVAAALAAGVGAFALIARRLQPPPAARKRGRATSRPKRSKGNPERRAESADPGLAKALLAGALAAGCLVLPLIFTIALEDVFALPKTIALRGLGVATGLILAFAAVRGARPVKFGVLDVAVVALAVLSIVATAASVDLNQSVFGERYQYQGLLTILAYLALFIAARFALSDIRSVRILSVALLTAAAVASLYALVQWVRLDPIWATLYKGRVFSTVGQANALATVLGMAVLLALPLSVGQGTRARAFLAGVLAIVVAAFLVTFSRGGYLGLVAGLAAAGLVVVPAASWTRLRPALPRAAAALAAAALVAGLLVLAWKPAGSLLTQITSRAASIANPSESSNLSHIDLWAVGVRIAADNPVLGTGPDTYVLVFPKYRNRVLPPDRAAVMARFRPESPHNAYLAAASGSGFPSLAAYLTIIGVSLVWVARAARRALPLLTRATLAGVVGAVTLYLVTSSFMTAEPASTAIFWVVLGSAAGFARRVLSIDGSPAA